jgi:1-deoxy-D-xylulose-5-phosphate reductoisomerase
MGAKITVDSATLMNKGFEVIEARWLFDLEPSRIGVLVHPESIVHSLVEYTDGSWMAQLGVPDMRIPISYTLGMPERLPLDDVASLDLVALGALPSRRPISVAFRAAAGLRGARGDGTAPAALNAANEVAVAAFLAGELAFTGIAAVAEEVLAGVAVRPGRSLDEIRDIDEQGRRLARRWIEERAS